MNFVYLPWILFSLGLLQCSSKLCTGGLRIALRMLLVFSLDPTYAALACPAMLLLHSLLLPPPPPPPRGSVEGSMWVVHSQVLVAAGLFLEVDRAVTLKVG